MKNLHGSQFAAFLACRTPRSFAGNERLLLQSKVHPDFDKGIGAQLGAQPPSRSNTFYDFHTKNTHFSPLSNGKRTYRYLKASAVTSIDNTEYKNKSVVVHDV